MMKDKPLTSLCGIINTTCDCTGKYSKTIKLGVYFENVELYYFMTLEKTLKQTDAGEY